MLDSKYLRAESAFAAARLATRNFALDTDKLAALEEQRKELQVKTQDLQAKRNSMSKSIGAAIARGEDVNAIKAEVKELGVELDAVKVEQDKILEEIRAYSLTVPNLPDESVPVGKDDSENVEVRRVGTPRTFDFPVLDHVALGEQLGELDFEDRKSVV